MKRGAEFLPPWPKGKEVRGLAKPLNTTAGSVTKVAEAAGTVPAANETMDSIILESDVEAERAGEPTAEVEPTDGCLEHSDVIVGELTLLVVASEHSDSEMNS